ncbi:13796_t:CDS:2 [Funneliformis geosporum]|uniref:13796_t:CDS:1 n=1 Tax=Funneliformis geosporum TaxID=1117311 RepID=A0A9W4T0P4_9GLOM|nr:13796_t:CDS:2 [Funneliformis geosporum]
MSSGKSALVLSTTGAIGKSLLRDLLKSGAFRTVTTIESKMFEYNGPNKEALVQKVVDFEKLQDYKEEFSGSYDTIFCTLESEFTENYAKEHIINAAKLIKQQNPKELHFLYSSSAGANVNSSFLYMKTKGEIEKELCDIGFNQISIFRPILFKTDKVRDKAGLVEYVFFNLTHLIDYVFPKWASVHIDIISKAMRRVAIEDYDIDVETTILDHGTLLKEINHMQIHEIGDAE